MEDQVQAAKVKAAYYLPHKLVRAVRIVAAQTDRQPTHIVEAALKEYLEIMEASGV